jgi:hypothetical protein
MDIVIVDNVDKCFCQLCGNTIKFTGLCNVCKSKVRKYSKKAQASHFWKGGYSKVIERINNTEWIKRRKECYKRDDWMCQDCGASKVRLNAHHIVPYRVGGSDKLDNLKSLCNQCHKIAEVKACKALAKYNA